MKRVMIFTVLIVSLIATAGFARGASVEKETRDLKGFTKVSFGVAGDLYINFGSEFKVVLEGEQKILDNIITEVNGGKLIIKNENWRMNNWRMNEKITVYVTMPEMEALGVSGSGKAEIKDALKSGDLNLSVSGSGRIYTSEVSVSNLSCSISGSGDIIPGGGNASRGDISISGSGNYNGESLKIGSAEMHISGSGNCTCNVTESLKASVSGSGNVTYEGNPRVDAHVSGSGKVRSR